MEGKDEAIKSLCELGERMRSGRHVEKVALHKAVLAACDSMTAETSNARGEALRFRKKPVVIEAMQLAGSAGEIHAAYQWIERNTLGSFEPMARIEGREPWPASGVSIDPRDGRLIIATLEGGHWADLGDWIIRGVQGEFYPCKPEIFAATYEPADAAPPPAAARGDVRGLAAELVALVEKWRSHPGGFGSVGRIINRFMDELTALAAEGVQAGEVDRIRAAQDAAIAKVGAELQAEQRARELLYAAWVEAGWNDEAAKVLSTGDDTQMRVVIAAIVAALSQQPAQQPEARGVVDEDAAFNGWVASIGHPVPPNIREMLRSAWNVRAALTGERNG